MIGKSTTARSIVLTLFVMGMTSCGPDEDLGRQEVSYQELNRQLTCLSDHAKSLLSGEKLLRPDGYAYTVDLAQLLILAARRDDKKGYRALSDRLLGSVYISGDKDPQAKGFVAWRYQKGAPLDASGTTEMLRLAQGL